MEVKEQRLKLHYSRGSYESGLKDVTTTDRFKRSVTSSRLTLWFGTKHNNTYGYLLFSVLRFINHVNGREKIIGVTLHSTNSRALSYPPKIILSFLHTADTKIDSDYFSVVYI